MSEITRKQATSLLRGANLVRATACFAGMASAMTVFLADYYFTVIDNWRNAQPAMGAPHLELLADTRLWEAGIRLPATSPAADAHLEDDAEVIGVCSGGRSRAYLLSALGSPEKGHVINDLLDGRAISITYCNLTQCTRVFTDPLAKGPLEIDVSGFVNKSLMLHMGEADYSQKTGECFFPSADQCIPYEEWPHVTTTWKMWRETHPDTDVYVGDPARSGL